MNKELDAIRDAMDKTSGDGRDYDKAVELSHTYVDNHPEDFAGMHQFDDDLPLLVQLLSKRRDDGDDEGAWKVQAWILHQFPPQNIGGEYKAAVRFPVQ